MLWQRMWCRRCRGRGRVLNSTHHGTGTPCNLGQEGRLGVCVSTRCVCAWDRGCASRGKTVPVEAGCLSGGVAHKDGLLGSVGLCACRQATLGVTGSEKRLRE